MGLTSLYLAKVASGTNSKLEFKRAYGLGDSYLILVASGTNSKLEFR